MATSTSNPYSARADGGVYSWSDLSSYGKGQFITTGIQSIGDLFTTRTKAKASNYVARIQAEIAEANARLENLKANQALARANQQISTLTMRYGQVKSAQKVGFAANGVKAANGSYQEVLATTDLYKKMDMDTAYANGLNAAFGYMSKAPARSAAARPHETYPVGSSLPTGYAYARVRGFSRLSARLPWPQ